MRPQKKAAPDTEKGIYIERIKIPYLHDTKGTERDNNKSRNSFFRQFFFQKDR